MTLAVARATVGTFPTLTGNLPEFLEAVVAGKPTDLGTTNVLEVSSTDALNC
jgi:hypothetical protein